MPVIYHFFPPPGHPVKVRRIPENKAKFRNIFPELY